MVERALDPVRNLTTVEVDGLYAAGVTTVNLQSGEGSSLPAPATDGNFNLIWWNGEDYSNPEDDDNVEIVRVTARSTDQLTVTRGQEGTADTSKNTASKTYSMRMCPTKRFRDDIARHTIGLETDTTETIDGSGVIEKSSSSIKVTPNAAADDALSTINAPSGETLVNGELLLLRPTSSSYKITLDSAGNIDPGAHNIPIKNADDAVLLKYDGTASKWRPLMVWYDEPLWWCGNTANQEVHTNWVPIAYDTSSYNDLGQSHIAEFHREDARVIGANVHNYTASSTRYFLECYVEESSQGGIYTSNGSDIAVQGFCGTHLSQFKDKDKIGPRGGVVICLDELIENEFSYYLETKKVPIKNSSGEIEIREQQIKHFVNDDDPSVLPSWEKVVKDVSDINRYKQVSYIDGTTTRMDKRVFGVCGGGEKNPRNTTTGRNDRLLRDVCCVGESVIRVTDTNGNIEAGDFLQSSSVEWEAEKQTDDILHSYTIAKAKISVDFSTIPVDPAVGHKWALIPCTLHCG